MGFGAPGQLVGLQDPRGSRGRRTAYKVPGGQGVGLQSPWGQGVGYRVPEGQGVGLKGPRSQGIGYRVPSGQGVGLRALRGSRGRPTGSSVSLMSLQMIMRHICLYISDPNFFCGLTD